MSQQTQKIQKKEIPKKEERLDEVLVRISGYDIPGTKNVYTGLTKIKGVSWSISNVICVGLNLDKRKKISDLTKDEVKKTENFLQDMKIYDFLKNRRKDRESGENKHHIGSELEMKKDFDIRRMKKIRSYKGVRHIAGQPVRGQSTRSHFRSRSRQAVGVRKGSGVSGGEKKK